MPKIPIIRSPEFRDRAGGLGDGPEPLSSGQTEALKALQARTERIDRELAVSRAWRAGVERLSETEEMPGGAPVGFTRDFLTDLDAERAQLLKPLPADAQAPLERDLLDLRTDFLDRAAGAEASGMALRRRAGLYDALDEYAAGVSREPGLLDQAAERMDALILGLNLPEKRQGAMRSYVRTVLGNAAVDRMMEEPSRVERLLSGGLYDDVLPEPVKAVRLKEAQDRIARDQHMARERTVADLTAQAHDGAASDDAILDAERKGTLSPAEAAYLRQTNATATEATVVRDARIQRVATATERLDPTNPEDQAAGSAYWDSVAEVYVSDDPKQQQENELRFVERAGVLPKTLESKYRGALLSGDPAVVVQGAEAIARLASRDPAHVRGIPAAEVRRAQAIAEYAALGIEPDVAVEHGDRKVADAIRQGAGPTRPGEIQVAANDEPPVMSDATEFAAADKGTAGSEGVEDGTGIQSDGSAVIVDPETGDRTTIDHENVERIQVLAQDQASLIAIRERFLEIYDSVASKEITRDDAAKALRAILDAQDDTVIKDSTVRQELERVASDILYAVDRDAAFNVFTQRLLSPDRQTEIGRELLSYLPVVGEVVSAVEAFEAFSAASEAWRRGNTDEALRQAGDGGLAALGMVPLLGKALRVTRGGIKVFRTARQLLGRRKRIIDSSSPELAPSKDGLAREGISGDGISYDELLDYDDPRLITDTGHPFSMWRKARYKTNRQLRKDWEEHHGKEWPIDPETGRKMDVHHVIPLADGGADHVSNIVPLTRSEHIRIHKEAGDFERWARRAHYGQIW